MSAPAGWEALRALFVTRLHDRIGVMRETLTRIEEGQEASSDLQRQFHSLAGIGGTFGYPALTDLAREGEGILESPVVDVSLLCRIVAQLSCLATQLPVVETSVLFETESRPKPYLSLETETRT
jgi:HPt (histidine-containing phosphotransfer) domain-containing protein